MVLSAPIPYSGAHRGCLVWVVLPMNRRRLISGVCNTDWAINAVVGQWNVCRESILPIGKMKYHAGRKTREKGNCAGRAAISWLCILAAALTLANSGMPAAGG